LNSLFHFAKKPFDAKGDMLHPYTKEIDTTEKKDRRKGRINIAPIQLKYINLIGELCLKYHIRLHMYTAPFYVDRYEQAENADELGQNEILPLSRKYNGDFKNFSNLEFTKNPHLFADVQHLNVEGRRVFNDTLANYYRPQR
jgi:hypothetical protein